MTDEKRVNRLIEQIRLLIAFDDSRHNLIVNTRISKFYYMEKVEELKELARQHHEVRERMRQLGAWMDECYKEVFCQWSRDVRWLNVHLIRNSGRLVQ